MVALIAIKHDHHKYRRAHVHPGCQAAQRSPALRHFCGQWRVSARLPVTQKKPGPTIQGCTGLDVNWDATSGALFGEHGLDRLDRLMHGGDFSDLLRLDEAGRFLQSQHHFAAPFAQQN